MLNVLLFASLYLISNSFGHNTLSGTYQKSSQPLSTTLIRFETDGTFESSTYSGNATMNAQYGHYDINNDTVYCTTTEIESPNSLITRHDTIIEEEFKILSDTTILKILSEDLDSLNRRFAHRVAPDKSYEEWCFSILLFTKVNQE